LNPEQEQAVGDAIAANVAVQIYRQSRLLEEQNPELARAAASSGCNIITNCSSCSRVQA